MPPDVGDGTGRLRIHPCPHHHHCLQGAVAALQMMEMPLYHHCLQGAVAALQMPLYGRSSGRRPQARQQYSRPPHCIAIGGSLGGWVFGDSPITRS